MKKIRTILIYTICFALVFSGTAFAAETEDLSAPAAAESAEEISAQPETDAPLPAGPEDAVLLDAEETDGEDPQQEPAEGTDPEAPAGEDPEAPVSEDPEAPIAEDPEEPLPADPEAEDPSVQNPETDTDDETETEDPAAPSAEDTETPAEDPSAETETEEPAEPVPEETEPVKEDLTAEEETVEEKTEEPEEEALTEEKEEKEEKEKKQEVQKAAATATAKISVVSSNANVGRFTFAVSGMNTVKNLSAVRLKIWHAADTSDRHWYNTSLKSDGTYQATMYRYLHQDHTGTFTIYAVAYYKDGTSKIVARSSVTVNNPEPKVTIARTSTGYTFTANYIRNASKTAYVQFAVWSTANGQDDIQWYTASFDKKKICATFSTDLKKHSGSGEYNVHAYTFDAAGTPYYVQEGKFTVAGSTPSCSSFSIKADKPAGTFEIIARDVYSPKELANVQFAVWCRSDKSDLVWYTAKAIGTNKYSASASIKKHGKHKGTYHVKAFVKYTSGKRVQFFERTFEMRDTASSLSAKVKDSQNYTITLNNTVAPLGIEEVKFAVWSDVNGQDDLQWYTGSGKNGGNYTCTVPLKKHSGMGLYHVHAYLTPTVGKESFIKETTFRVDPKISYQLTTGSTAGTDGKFYVNVGVTKTNLKIKKMKFAVWCKANKSDIYWYHVKGNSTDHYKCWINTANHLGSRGNYHIDISVVFENGYEMPLTSKTQYFKPKAYLSVPTSKGTFSRKVVYVNPSVPSVKFKIWTVRGGTGDSKTYTGKKDSNGNFYADVYMDDFVFDGKYQIQVLSGSTVLDTGYFIMIDYLEEAVRMALDESIGYSQIHRCLNPDVDCSSMVHYSLLNTGYNIPNGWPLTTYNEEPVLRGAGFSMRTYTNVTDLQAGDILLRDGHTEIYLGNGKTVGAHGDENNDIYGYKTGDQTGHEVCVADIVENWLYAFRLVTFTT